MFLHSAECYDKSKQHLYKHYYENPIKTKKSKQ